MSTDADPVGAILGRPASNASPTEPEAFQAKTDARGLSSAGTADPDPSSHSVLAERIASTLMHHQPGWRLPRRTALARRYNVSAEQLDAALKELADRHLVRLLPDGQLYRASPADYLIQLKGVHGFASCIDPMGAVISCHSFYVSWRRVPEEIGQALGVDSSSVCVARLVWTADETPAAVTTTYLTSIPPGLVIGEQPAGPVAALTALPLPLILAQPNETDAAEVAGAFRMQALSVEMRPPPPQIARSLHLSAAEAATLLTALFENSGNGAPAALTVAVLRPDMFRITIEWPGSRDRPQS